mgnify:CR=1 FL=1
MKEKELIEKIAQWAKDRNLILGSTPQKQFIKLMEEFGELCAGIARNDKEKIKDSIGDCFVVMVILVKQNHIDSILEKISNLDSFQPAFELDTEEIISETVINLGMLASELIGQNLEIPTNVDSIFGCPFLSLKLISRKYNLMLKDCVQAAWDEIKDRKGRMIDGVFVKEEDL